MRGLKLFNCLYISCYLYIFAKKISKKNNIFLLVFYYFIKNINIFYIFLIITLKVLLITINHGLTIKQIKIILIKDKY